MLTALLGALAWDPLEPVSLLGGVLAAVAWVAVVEWRYRLGWIRSDTVGIAAWAAAVVLAALELIGTSLVSTLDVPGAYIASPLTHRSTEIAPADAPPSSIVLLLTHPSAGLASRLLAVETSDGGSPWV